MSIILKGIDMPKTGERVYAEIRPSGEVEYIAVTYDKDYTRSAKVERTNAIQIPKNHGAIKDIDTFLKNKCLYEYEDGYRPFNYKFVYLVSTEAIHNAPTILESED